MNEFPAKCFFLQNGILFIMKSECGENARLLLRGLDPNGPFEFVSRVSNKNISEIFDGASELY